MNKTFIKEQVVIGLEAFGRGQGFANSHILNRDTHTYRKRKKEGGRTLKEITHHEYKSTFCPVPIY